MSPAFILLTLVGLERLAELAISNRNTRRLMAEGATEAGAGHYPLIVGVHTFWLVSLFFWVGFNHSAINLGWLVVYLALQVLRVWVMTTLGRYWTTRIIVPREAPLIRSGPYRFVRHPNYVVVVLEIAVLPLVVDAWPVAVIFTVLNGVALWVRIRAENETFTTRG
jgi:methyltransferase